VRVTTDALSPFEAGGRWWAVEFPDHAGLVTDIAALIDEVRASRAVLEAVVEWEAAEAANHAADFTGNENEHAAWLRREAAVASLRAALKRATGR
jgi:hypothetical protein